jgi:hypothetical protein
LARVALMDIGGRKMADFGVIGGIAMRKQKLLPLRAAAKSA